MATLVSQVSNAAPPASGISIGNIIIIGFLGLVGYVIWKALKEKKKEEVKTNRYLEALNMIRGHALVSADDRYFKSWYRPSKNSQVTKQFCWKETGKMREEPLLGNTSQYMGHYVDSKGNYILAIATGVEYLIMPIVEVVVVPGSLVHMQDHHIIVNCISVEKKSHNMPYWPVVQGVDGKIVQTDFFFVNSFWEEMVSTEVIEKHGNQFVEALEKVTKVNPHVSIKRKTRGTDSGF